MVRFQHSSEQTEENHKWSQENRNWSEIRNEWFPKTRPLHEPAWMSPAHELNVFIYCTDSWVWGNENITHPGIYAQNASIITYCLSLCTTNILLNLISFPWRSLATRCIETNQTHPPWCTGNVRFDFIVSEQWNALQTTNCRGALWRWRWLWAILCSVRTDLVCVKIVLFNSVRMVL
jgi:hypothetical protein